MPGVAVGNVIVLNTGTLTSIQNFAGASPAGGSFPTFLVDNNGTRLDAVNGVSAAPEPSTWALLSVGASLVGVATWHRRVSQA